MIKFILRRLLVMVPTFFVVSLLTFIIIQLPPGDYVTTTIANLAATGEAANLEKVELLRKQAGLDLPLPVQYFRWVTHMLTGDLGHSMLYAKPVADLIWERLGLTTFIAIVALLVAWIIALPIGIYSAVRQYGVVDYTATTGALVGTATPPFLMALVFLFLANRYLGISLGGLFSDEFVNAAWSWARAVDFSKHVWLPVIILAISAAGGMMRTMRANLLDQMQMQYVTTARAKGLPEWRVIVKHPVRVAINPLISTIGWMLPQMISAMVIVDVVLSLPTTGPLLLNALYAQDMYLAGALVMMMSVLTMFGTLISDVLLAWVDPRIRFEAGAE
jgi:peptide/nickel transport system permease protein